MEDLKLQCLHQPDDDITISEHEGEDRFSLLSHVSDEEVEIVLNSDQLLLIISHFGLVNSEKELIKTGIEKSISQLENLIRDL